MSEFTCLRLLHVPGAGSKRKEKDDEPKASKKLKVGGSPWQEQHTIQWVREQRGESQMDACKRILEAHVIQVIISDVVKCVPYLVDLLLSSSLVHAGPKDPEPEDDEESGGLLEQLLVNCIVVCQTLEHVSCNVCVCLCVSVCVQHGQVFPCLHACPHQCSLGQATSLVAKDAKSSGSCWSLA